MVGFNNNP